MLLCCYDISIGNNLFLSLSLNTYAVIYSRVSRKNTTQVCTMSDIEILFIIYIYVTMCLCLFLV